MSKALPRITHLQFAVLASLIPNERAGREVRERLRKAGVRQTHPAFYQMMARLEDAGLVEGRYVTKEVAGQKVKERRYRITDSGREAWRDCKSFFLENLRLAELEA